MLKPGQKKMGLLTLAALGVVFGDIGTSPLYALHEIFFARHGIEPSPIQVLGCVSLVIWALTVVIALKYVFFVLRADNDGEGGVFALYGLLHRRRTHRNALGIQGVLWLLILAAGLLFGDGVITPAISVLSAVEGLQVAAPGLAPSILPITIFILTLLFFVQSRGTAKVGAAFGPIVCLWFLAISILGLRQIFLVPQVIAALNPWHAVQFVLTSPMRTTLIALGGVILAITGGEALYADMGHFGRTPIHRAWFFVVFPSLILNYLGQGAFLLSAAPLAGGSLFFALVPRGILFPMVLLATAATVIASQALISGAFSLVAQAVALGLLPRVKVVHTHHDHVGQIYSPLVNSLLYLSCVILVLSFRTSTALASAYGFAEAGVMLGTSIAMVAVSRMYWQWSVWVSVLVFVTFAAIDSVFLFSNALKILEGGYVPLGLGAGLFVVMVSWRWGRKSTFAAYSSVPTMTVQALTELKARSEVFLERNAVLMVPRPVHLPSENTPALLQLLWNRHGLLPKNLLFVEVVHRKVPVVHGERCVVRVLHRTEHHGSIMSVTIQFGFMEDPDVELALEALANHHEINLDPSPSKWIVHVTHENLLPSPDLSRLNRFRFRLFSVLRQISTPGYYYYGLGKKVQLSVEILPVYLK